MQRLEAFGQVKGQCVGGVVNTHYIQVGMYGL